jgi:hemerythrin-like metal-binding protein
MITWSVSWNTGFDNVDDQHKILFDLIGKLISAGLFSDEAVEVLDEIIEYAKFHFAEEEESMQKYQYPQYSTHLFAHLNLIQELNATKLYLKKHGRFKQDPKHFMVKWLVNHIQFEDMLYVNHFKLAMKTDRSLNKKTSNNSSSTDPSPSFYIFDPKTSIYL